MLMLCWHYCVGFFQFMLYAVGPILLIYACFMFKRGVIRQRPALRRFSLIFGLLVSVKVFLLDTATLSPVIACSVGACSQSVLIKNIGLGMFLMLGVGFWRSYKKFGAVYDEGREYQEPNKPEMRAWALMSMLSVSALIVWQIMPWAGALIMGTIPGFFQAVPWQLLATICFTLLLIGFWKLEDENPKKASYRDNAKRTTEGWRPRDTLWTALILYLIVLALSFVAEDILHG